MARYEKNSICITEKFDVPLLLLVRNSRFITKKQLSTLAGYTKSESSMNSFRWRLRRLVRGGFVKVEHCHLNGQAVFTITDLGIEHLELFGHILVSVDSQAGEGNDAARILHATLMNEIRLKLASYRTPQTWISCLEVAEANLTLPGQYAIDYHAVVQLVLGGQRVRLGIICEGKSRSEQQYSILRNELAKEVAVDRVLYLVEDAARERLAIDQLRGVRPPVIVGSARLLRGYGLDAVMHVEEDSGTLEDLLLEAGARCCRQMALPLKKPVESSEKAL